jgi:hypothetical protein
MQNNRIILVDMQLDILDVVRRTRVSTVKTPVLVLLDQFHFVGLL